MSLSTADTIPLQMIPYLRTYQSLARKISSTWWSVHDTLPEPGEFLYFTKLPIEIQNMVWELLMPPTILEVYHGFLHKETGKLWNSRNYRYAARPLQEGYSPVLLHRNPLSPLLAICQVTRKMYLKRHNTKLCKHEISADKIRCSRFAPQYDVIYLPNQYLADDHLVLQQNLLHGGVSSLWSQKAKKNMRFLAIAFEVWSAYCLRGMSLASFPVLQQLYVVAHEKSLDDGVGECPAYTYPPKMSGAAFHPYDLLHIKRENEELWNKLQEIQSQIDTWSTTHWEKSKNKRPVIELAYYTVDGKKCCNYKEDWEKRKRRSSDF